MLHAATSTWVPTAIGVGLAALVLVLLVWAWARRPRRMGPAAWAEFEQQFAAYVAGSGGPAREPGAERHDRADERATKSTRSARRRT